MNDPWNHYVKWKKPDTKRYMLYDSTYFKCLEYLIPQRQSISGFQGRGKGMVGVSINGFKVSFEGDEIVVKSDRSEDCPTLWIY